MKWRLHINYARTDRVVREALCGTTFQMKAPQEYASVPMNSCVRNNLSEQRDVKSGSAHRAIWQFAIKK